MTRKKILMVEDDADVRLGLHVLLTANHYATSFATGSSSAVSEAQKYQPDLVLLDLGLPAGDAFIVMERFRTNMHLAAIPIVAVSARDLHGTKARALQAGARAFVLKPWNDHELLALITQFLDQPDLSLSQPV